jgi:hypothetical protein
MRDMAAGDPHTVSGIAAFHEGCSRGTMLGDQYRPQAISDLMESRMDLLHLEYQEVNAHLRVNINQFVNWFSFFLTFDLVSAAVFVGLRTYGPERHGFVLRYGIPIVFILMHILAFTGILIFRHYLIAAHSKVEEIISQLGERGVSPIPLRFCRWMTDLMAAGFLLSYLVWFLLLFFS